jgi:hypothetical protein
LGVNDRTYYFLNARGQFAALPDKDIGRNAIIGLFGGDEYLRTHWPKWDKSGKFTVNFDHGAMSPVLISSCHDKGIWTPEDNVRGVGTWSEESDGGEPLLVMHCGDKLFVSSMPAPVATGLRGRMLYPAASPQPHPCQGAGRRGRPGRHAAGQAEDLELGARRAGRQAASGLDRRGDPGRGAGLAADRVDHRRQRHRQIHPDEADPLGVRGARHDHIEDATPAGIKHRTKNSALPVSIDELESEGKNERARDITKLARIASAAAKACADRPPATPWRSPRAMPSSFPAS